MLAANSPACGGEVAAPSLDPLAGGEAGADLRGLDLAVARVIEQQAQSVLAGVQVAALHGTGDLLGHGAVLPGGCPSWLAADLDLLVQMVRLSAAAGVVLPHGVAAVAPAAMTDPDAHLAASRACHRRLMDVLTQMSITDELAPTCRDDALRLLQQVEDRIHHLDQAHPAFARQPHGHANRQPSEVMPGALLR